MHKQAKLKADEFNPYKAFKSFWQVPKPLVAYEGLSLGAKLLYGALVGLAGKYGTAYPTQQALQTLLGGPSLKTIYRWQQELVNKGLIRVKQKGRGLSNNYYFLRSPILENAHEGEFKSGPRFIFTDPNTGEDLTVTKEEAELIFSTIVKGWYRNCTEGMITEFPKPFWQYDRRWYAKYKKEWEQLLKDHWDQM